jgi:hypothetical protein
MPRLREADGARADRPSARLAEVVRALGHAERLVHLEPEARAPCGQHLGRQRLARTHAVPERGHVGGAGRGLLEDLPVDRGHGDERRRRMPREELHPPGRVGRALGEDRGVAAVEWVHHPGAQHVRPVEAAGVQHPVAVRAEVEPVLRRRLASRGARDARAARPSDGRSCPTCRRGRPDRPRASDAAPRATPWRSPARGRGRRSVLGAHRARRRSPARGGRRRDRHPAPRGSYGPSRAPRRPSRGGGGGPPRA